MARHNEKTDVIDMIEVMEVEGKPLARMRICITGHLAKPRTEIVKLIKSAGGEFHASVRYDTTHLLTNADWSSGTLRSTKYTKAREYGCKFITEEQFLAMLMG